jgi:uncharacterized protein (DUF433 family)
MTTMQKSLRLSSEVVKAIERLAVGTGKDFSGLARDLLEEAIKMRRCPGITFADGPAGRRARLAGTGIDVWEIIAAYKGLGKDGSRLKESYHWLNEQQLRAAFSYYTLNPEEIDRQIEDNEALDESSVLEKYPFLSETGTGS